MTGSLVEERHLSPGEVPPVKLETGSRRLLAPAEERPTGRALVPLHLVREVRQSAVRGRGGTEYLGRQVIVSSGD